MKQDALKLAVGFLIGIAVASVAGLFVLRGGRRSTDDASDVPAQALEQLVEMVAQRLADSGDAAFEGPAGPGTPGDSSLRMPLPTAPTSDSDVVDRLRAIEQRLGRLNPGEIEKLVKAELQAQLSSSDLGSFNPVNRTLPPDHQLVQELVATARADEESLLWAQRQLLLLTVPEIIAKLGWPTTIYGKNDNQDLSLSWQEPGGSHISATISGGYVIYTYLRSG